MLFMITQVHTPQTCSIDDGGADALINKNAPGVTVKGRWGGVVAPYHLVPGRS